MGSPLRCIFANFYMVSLGIKFLSELENPSSFYARYIDYILLIINNEEELLSIKRTFQENSSLECTDENGYHKLPFLDVLLEADENTIDTSVYRKTNNT